MRNIKMPYKTENIVKKGQIACYKQFPYSQNVFHSYISLVRQNLVLCGNGIPNIYYLEQNDAV